MTEHNMDHMKFLEAVAFDDVEVLRAKETTYQGSWKRAGGASAWFMLRRNMDRLLEMMKPPSQPHDFSMADLDDLIERPTPEGPMADGGDRTLDVSLLKYLRDHYVADNIFAMIRDAPKGEDGTVLAVMRDLRRYCVLVEAEMMARGVVESPMVDVHRDEAKKATHRHDISGGQPLSDIYGTVAGEAGGGGGHVSFASQPAQTHDSSFAIGSSFAIDHSAYINIVKKAADIIYDEWAGKKLYLLTPHLTRSMEFEAGMQSALASGILSSCYSQHGVDGLILRIQDAPEQYRNLWPVFAVEYNSHEMSKQPAWVRVMYQFNESSSKWIIKNEHAAWTRD